jgi:hypothetical protein
MVDADVPDVVIVEELAAGLAEEEEEAVERCCREAGFTSVSTFETGWSCVITRSCTIGAGSTGRRSAEGRKSE